MKRIMVTRRKKPWIIEHGGHMNYETPPGWPMVGESSEKLQIIQQVKNSELQIGKRGRMNYGNKIIRRPDFAGGGLTGRRASEWRNIRRCGFSGRCARSLLIRSR